MKKLLLYGVFTIACFLGILVHAQASRFGDKIPTYVLFKIIKVDNKLKYQLNNSKWKYENIIDRLKGMDKSYIICLHAEKDVSTKIINKNLNFLIKQKFKHIILMLDDKDGKTMEIPVNLIDIDFNSISRIPPPPKE
jgi:ribosome biogenesis protein Nip4